MSKRRDAFVESIANYGFDRVAAAAAYNRMISIGLHTERLKQVIAYDEGRVFYTLDIYNFPGQIGPYLYGYNATLRCVPPIKHDVIAGIDTAKLEQRMRSTDWLTPAPFAYTALPDAAEAEKRLIWQLMENLKQTGDERAIDIVQLLQVKHWAGTLAEFNNYLDLMTYRYDRPYYFTVSKQDKGITAEHAFALLSGRSVFRLDPEPGSNQGYWTSLERIVRMSSTRYFDDKAYPDFNLREALDRSLHEHKISISDRARVLAELMAGKIPQGIQAQARKFEPVKLTVDAIQQKVVVQEKPKLGLRTRNVLKHPDKGKGPSL